jgi:serralysin
MNLFGTAGNDSYTGTSGVADTAVIGSNHKNAIFSFDGTRWTVSSSVGSDTLTSVESVQFLDATFGLTAGVGATLVSTGSYSGQESSSIARLPDGGWVVTWHSYQQDGDGYGVYMRRYSAAGEAIGGETLVNTTTAGTQQAPSVSALSGGGYVVAWVHEGYNPSTYLYERTVVFQRYDAGGSKVGVETTVDTAGGMLTDLEVSGVAGGGYAVTWADVSGASYTLSAQLYNGAGTKVGAELTLAASSASELTGLEIVGLASGYVAVWQKGDAIYQQLVSSAGAKIGAPVQVSGSETGNVEPAVAALEGGGYAVAWVGSVAGSGERSVFVQRFDSAGAKTGTSYAVDGDTLPYGDSIAAAGLDDGGFVVVWRSGAYPQGLYLQRFDSAGVATGDPQSVNGSGYSTDASDPDVVGLANGGFAVSWNSPGSDVVYTQRYNADGDASMSEIAGTAGNDTITFNGSTRVKLIGASGNDSLTGGSGSDVLDGGVGTDTMTGGAGNDTYVWQTGDTIVETAAGGVDTVRTGISYTLASRHLENAVLTGSAKADLVGNGGANRLTGNSADNVLNGGGGADTLVGGGGSDTYVVDDAGDRAIEAAGGGIDTVISSVTHVLAANVEHLRLGGAAAIDGTGNAEANLLTGNAYANRLDGRAGADTLIGGLGDDTYVLDAAARDEYREYDGEGRDTIEIDKSWVLNSAADSIENLTLREGGAYSGTGDGIANVIRGNSSANLIDGKAGADTMDGGAGSDTYVVDSTGDIASEVAYSASDLVKSSVTHTLGSNIENLTLTGTLDRNGTGNGLANVITGNSGANRLDGQYGSDTVLGGAGNDRLTSADGMDSLVGGSGSDTYVVSSETDEIVELSAQGTDAVVATVTRSYTLNDNVEKLTLVGTHIDGHGNVLANSIIGTNGNNLLDGAGGADTLTGLAGDDVYLVDHSGDSVVEATSAGTDEVYAKITWTLGTHIENLTLEGSAAINGTGNALANRMIGNDAANTLLGGSGNDLLMGYGGADVLDGGSGTDTLKGGAGNDTYVVGSASDVIAETSTTVSEVDLVKSSVSWALGANLEKLALQGSAAINGTGNGLLNTLVGNSGANVLDGGSGSDTLAGGAGADTFVFRNSLSAASNVDRITDFSVVDDRIQLENGIFKAFGSTGGISSANLRAGAGVTTAADANDHLLYNATTGALYYDADGSGSASAAIQFATLGTGLALTGSDFVII